MEQGSGEGGRRQRVGGEGWGGGGKKGEEVRLVWQRERVEWASNSGHRARMTSNRSRALCQHSPGPNTSVILISRFIDGKPWIRVGMLVARSPSERHEKVRG